MGYVTISASAQTESSFVILTFTWFPRFAPRTKTKKPLTLAMPSPFGLISTMSTSYSFSISTGRSSRPLPRLFLAFLGARFLGLIGHLPRFGYYLPFIQTYGLRVLRFMNTEFDYIVMHVDSP